MALDLALSVGTHTPCLDRFPVVTPGPVLAFLAEDRLAEVRQRVVLMASHRGLSIDDVDLHVITSPVLRLDDPTDRARLSLTLGRVKPRLLILDPLVRCHAIDENSSHDVSALLGFLRALSREHRLAIVVVHHMSKRLHRDLGQSLRGSSDLYAWSDCSAYLTKRRDHYLLTLEHRAAQPPSPMSLKLVVDKDRGTIHLEIVDSGDGEGEGKDSASLGVTQRVLDLLKAAPAPLSAIALRDRLHVRNQHIRHVLAALEADGLIERTESGFSPRLPKRRGGGGSAPLAAAAAAPGAVAPVPLVPPPPSA
jgi:hypothetical protein